MARRSRGPQAIALVVAGTVASGATVALVAGSDVLTHPHPNAVVRGMAVALFAWVGAYTWWRRPDSALGLLVAGTGLSFSLTSLMALDESLPFTLGRVALALFIVLTAYVFVCFPRDHLGPGVERGFIRALALSSLVVWAVALPLTDKLPQGGPVAQCSRECPRNALRLVSASSTVSDALTAAVSATTALALLGVTVLLVAKARSPDRLRRRAVQPLLLAMSATVLSYALYIAIDQIGVGGTEVLGAIVITAFLSLPLGMLVGQVRGRIFAATRLGQLVATAGDAHVTPERVQSLIADALGDPTLTLLLWSLERGGLVDVHGSPASIPLPTSDRVVTPVSHDGQPVAALIHDRSLDHGQDMTEGIAATALTLLDNARLAEELRASRTRIVKAALDERVRLEHDLHDGAQQRLIAIQIKLSLVRELEDPIERDAVLDELEDDAAAAVDELRDLAHGIYPPLLRERGVADAVSSAASSAPGRVTVRHQGTARYPPATEAAVYFSMLEAMQNALKHAGPDAHIQLSVESAEAGPSFVVADDGQGFDVALRSDGLGLASMRDRMAAIGGALVVNSAPGHGTTVSGTAPARQENEESER
jgi:signal transduction histidine kinase